MTTYATTPAGTSETDSEKLLRQCKEWLKECVDAEANQRLREKEDLSWQVAENQWDDAAKAERQGGIQSGIAIPARPMLSINLTQQPLQLIKNQAEAADLGVTVNPISELASKEDAEIKEGLYQRIERDSNAEQVRIWSMDRGSQCGRGYYRVNTQWDEDGDDEFDQEIVIERIFDQSTVYMDPAAQKQDKSDAEYGCIVGWMRYSTFKRKYPNANMDLYGGGDGGDLYGSAISLAPDWVREMDGHKSILVAEFFYKEHDYEEIERGGRKRTKDRVTVKWCTVTGVQVLEEQEWNGHLIPIIFYPGRELQPFDGEHRYEGVVRPARGGQKGYNYAISGAVEDVGRLSKVPYVGAAGQFEGFEAQWQQANRRNWPYLEYNTKDVGGNPLPPPQPMQIDGSKLGLSLQLAETCKGLVQTATAMYDQMLGEGGGKHESGRRTLALQQQADASTSNYLQNLANVAMRYEARVVLDLMPAIYDRPGRVTRILGAEGEEQTVMLGKAYVMDPATGRPKAVPQGTPGAKFYDLSKGKYSVAVSVGKSYQTRLQQGQEEFGKLLESMPPELQVLLLPTYLKFRDSPGSKEAAELLTKYRDSKFQGLTGDKDQQPTPEQMQAQLAGMQQKLQEGQQMLQSAIQQIQTKQAEQEGKIRVAEIQREADIQLQILRNAGAVAVAETNAQAKGAILAREAQNEAQALGREHAFEADQAERERQQAAEQTKLGMAHEVGMGAAGGTTMNVSREGGQEQGQERTEEQGAETLPPEPEVETGGEA